MMQKGLLQRYRRGGADTEAQEEASAQFEIIGKETDVTASRNDKQHFPSIKAAKENQSIQWTILCLE